MLDVVIVADVHEFCGLLLQGFYERGCAVAQTNNADAANEIEVLFAFVIGEHHAVSAHEFDRLAGEGAHHVFRFKFLLLCEAHGSSLLLMRMRAFGLFGIVIPVRH